MEGSCEMRCKWYQDKFLGTCLRTQWHIHKNNKLRLDRKKLLDELDFVWKVEGPCNINYKVWHQQHEKLVEFMPKNGHCEVPCKYEYEHEHEYEYEYEHEYEHEHECEPVA